MRFVRLREEHLEKVLRWRTSERVTRFMFTDVAYDMDKQREWFRSVAAGAHSRYWVIVSGETEIGLVSLTRMHPVHRSAHWAYYIGEPEFGTAAVIVGPCLYRYAFGRLGLNKLIGEVMEENAAVRRIHLMHGAREVGVYREHIWKNGKFHNVVVYEMLADDWRRAEPRFAKYEGSFEE